MRHTAWIAERELRESLRDGRVLGMFLLPIVLYPTAFWALTQVLLLLDDRRPALAWEGAVDVPEALAGADVDWVGGGKAAYEAGEADGWIMITRGSGGATIDGSIRTTDRDALQRGITQLRRSEAQRVAPDLPASAPWVQLRLADKEPLDLRDVAAELAPFAATAPLLVMTLALSMVVYPALDAAQEHGRGTLTTTLLGPQRDRSVVWGKVLATSALAWLSVGAQLAVTAVSVAHFFTVALLTAIERDVIWPDPPSGVALLTAGLALTSAIVAAAAAFIAACVPFKDPQNALSASSFVMIALMLWLGAGLAPVPWSLLVPIANAVPVTVEALTVGTNPAHLAMVCAVNAAATVALVEVAALMLRRVGTR